jgi:hypothetical protein
MGWLIFKIVGLLVVAIVCTPVTAAVVAYLMFQKD